MFIQNKTKAPGATSGRPDTGCNALWQTLVKIIIKRRQKFIQMWFKKKKNLLDARECILTCYPGRVSWGRGYWRFWSKKKTNKKKNWLFHVTVRTKEIYWTLKNCVRLRYFFAKEIFMALVCVILKPCSESRAAPAWTSFSNSTKAMSWRPGTKRTSLNPGNLCEKPRGETHYEFIGEDTHIHKHQWRRDATDWLKSMESMSSFVSSGKLVRKRMWLGGFSETCVWGKRKRRKLLLFPLKPRGVWSRRWSRATCWGICPGICPGIIPPGGMAPGGIWPGAIPGGGIMLGGGIYGGWPGICIMRGAWLIPGIP